MGPDSIQGPEIVEYAVIQIPYVTDARGIMDFLPKRFANERLTIYTGKTKLVPFERPVHESKAMEAADSKSPKTVQKRLISRVRTQTEN